MPRSGYGARRSFATEGGSCEVWYGKGDDRCPSHYTSTGDLETDIQALKASVQYYEGGNPLQTAPYWNIPPKNFSTHGKESFDQWRKLLSQKVLIDADNEKKRLAEEQRTQSFLDAVNKAMEAKIRESAKIKPIEAEPIKEAVKYSPLIIAGIGIIVFIIILWRRR